MRHARSPKFQLSGPTVHSYTVAKVGSVFQFPQPLKKHCNVPGDFHKLEKLDSEMQVRRWTRLLTVHWPEKN